MVTIEQKIKTGKNIVNRLGVCSGESCSSCPAEPVCPDLLGSKETKEWIENWLIENGSKSQEPEYEVIEANLPKFKTDDKAFCPSCKAIVTVSCDHTCSECALYSLIPIEVATKLGWIREKVKREIEFKKKTEIIKSNESNYTFAIGTGGSSMPSKPLDGIDWEKRRWDASLALATGLVVPAIPGKHNSMEGQCACIPEHCVKLADALIAEYRKTEVKND